MPVTFVCPSDDCDGDTWTVQGSIIPDTEITQITCTTCGTGKEVI